VEVLTPDIVVIDDDPAMFAVISELCSRRLKTGWISRVDDIEEGILYGLQGGDQEEIAVDTRCPTRLILVDSYLGRYSLTGLATVEAIRKTAKEVLIVSISTYLDLRMLGHGRADFAFCKVLFPTVLEDRLYLEQCKSRYDDSRLLELVELFNRIVLP